MQKKLLLFSFLLSAATAFSAAVPQYLVVGKSPSKLEKTAENELQYFWQKIFGRKLTVINETQSRDKSVIYLGRTVFAEKNKADFSGFGEEEWLLESVGDDLIITGGRPAGTLYGVYQMLEKLGVEFLSFDETFIPRKVRSFPVFKERRSPAFVGRVIYDSIAPVMQRTRHKTSVWAKPEVIKSYQLWLLRRRINGANSKSICPFYVGRIYNICHWPEWHTMSHYVPPALFDKHPEYFALDSTGKRVRPRSFTMRGDVCMSNEKVREVALESLRKMIKNDRAKRGPDEWSTVYDVTRLDDTPAFCQCRNCRSIAVRQC